MNLENASAIPEELSKWERVALTRWGKYVSEVERRVVLKAHQIVADPGILLDYGCGEGRWSRLLCDYGWRALCLDIDEVALSKCVRRNPAAQCLLVDRRNTHLPWEDGYLKMILCIEVCGVLESEWFPHEAARVLADDGLVVGVFFNRQSLRGGYRHVVDRLRHTAGFYQRDFRTWKKAFENVGFRFLHAQGICWLPFHRESNSSLVPVLTNMEERLGLRSLPSFSPWVIFVAQRTTPSTGMNDIQR